MRGVVRQPFRWRHNICIDSATASPVGRTGLEWGTVVEQRVLRGDEFIMAQKQSTCVAASGGLAIAMALAFCTWVIGQDRPKIGFKDTPMLPGGKWHVHDGDRPLPPIVTPGTCSTQDEPGRPPSDAVVLFDGTDLSHWNGRRGRPAAWKIVEGALVIAPGTGEIVTQGRVRRLPAPPRVRLARAAAGPRPGPGQQRRDVLRPVRDPGARQL